MAMDDVRAVSASRAVYMGGAFGRHEQRHAFSVEIVAPGVVQEHDGFAYFSPAAILNAGENCDGVKAVVARLLEQAKAAEVRR